MCGGLFGLLLGGRALASAVVASEGSSLEVKTWGEVREAVKALNVELFQAIESVSPSDDFKLFLGRYPYGAKILEQGLLHVPTEHHGLLPLTDSRVSAVVRESLGYNVFTNPVSIVLNNSVEVFVPLRDRIVPLYGIIEPGNIFSTWRVLNQEATHAPAFIWEMTAGARMFFMLPKISRAVAHDRMCSSLSISARLPDGLIDHWQVFKEIANHPGYQEPWTTEILFFSKKWFDHLDDKAWHSFKFYLLERGWKGSEFWRNKFTWDLIFSTIQERRNIRVSPHIADLAKHIFSIAVGALPGFAPATNTLGGPIDSIQKAYVNGSYGLRDYVPTIMQPTFFNMHKADEPVYYSLNFPASLSFSPSTRQRSSLITDLYHLKSFISTYVKELAGPEFNIRATPLYEAVQQVDFDCFHLDSEHYHDMQHVDVIPNEDNRFYFSFAQSDGNTKFATNNAFTRACVRVSSGQ